jgi:hypothetical protein
MYLGGNICYETTQDVKSKIHKFQDICENISAISKLNLRKEAKLIFYTAIAVAKPLNKK